MATKKLPHNLPKIHEHHFPTTIVFSCLLFFLILTMEPEMNKTTTTTLDEKADGALGGMKHADPSEDTTRDGNTKSSSIGCHLDTIAEEEEDEGDEQGEQKENEETPHYNAKEVYRKIMQACDEFREYLKNPEVKQPQQSATKMMEAYGALVVGQVVSELEFQWKKKNIVLSTQLAMSKRECERHQDLLELEQMRHGKTIDACKVAEMERDEAQQTLTDAVDRIVHLEVVVEELQGDKNKLQQDNKTLRENLIKAIAAVSTPTSSPNNLPTPIRGGNASKTKQDCPRNKGGGGSTSRGRRSNHSGGSTRNSGGNHSNNNKSPSKQQYRYEIGKDTLLPAPAAPVTEMSLLNKNDESTVDSSTKKKAPPPPPLTTMPDNQTQTTTTAAAAPSGLTDSFLTIPPACSPNMMMDSSLSSTTTLENKNPMNGLDHLFGLTTTGLLTNAAEPKETSGVSFPTNEQSNEIV